MYLASVIVTTSLFWHNTFAFPALASNVATSTSKRAGPIDIDNEANSGFFPNLGFDAKDQYVDVSPGSGHEFQPPGPNDIRGPCPALNAAANHGFISRSGVIDLEDSECSAWLIDDLLTVFPATAGLAKAFNFGLDFAATLFVFGVLNSGSIVDMKWSIGGPMPTDTLGGLLGQGQGISNSHLKYEGDGSPGRVSVLPLTQCRQLIDSMGVKPDAYMNNGDAHSLNITKYQELYDMAKDTDRFTFKMLRQHTVNNHRFSTENNPYFFSGPIFFVPPSAPQFTIAMMSNYSEQDVQGYLDRKILNSFFSVVEDENGKLEWIPGHERIPDNW